MKQSKSISKVGWIPGNEDIHGTWDAACCDVIDRNALATSKEDAKYETKMVGKSPRKVRVTLTLTVEDVK